MRQGVGAEPMGMPQHPQPDFHTGAPPPGFNDVQNIQSMQVFMQVLLLRILVINKKQSQGPVMDRQANWTRGSSGVFLLPPIRRKIGRSGDCIFEQRLENATTLSRSTS